MNIRIRTALVALISLAFAASASAQLVQKKALNLETAKQIAAAAEKEAAGSIEVAQQKAHSAVAFKRPTKAFEDAVAGGRTAILKLPGAMPVEGGLPLMADGKIVGAIGCSDGTSQQDGVVAKAGADALMKIVGHGSSE